MDLSKYHIENANAYLRCRHCINNKDCFEYYMPCIILKTTKTDKVKVVVFGDRFWENTEDNKRIRYVCQEKIIRRCKQ